MTLQTQTRSAEPRPVRPPESPKPCVCFVGSCAIRLWGMTPAERLMRIFDKHSVADIVDVSDLKTIDRPVIVIRADAVIDAPLVPLLSKQEGLVLLGDDMGQDRPVAVHASPEHAASAAEVLTGTAERVPAHMKANARRPDQLEAAYWKSLRKREVPYALVVSPENKRDVEWRTFMGTYKGATDLVTKHVWPFPAFFATRALAPTWVTPNVVTTISAVFVILALVLFMEAQWTLGIVCAWLMTFLDTVDGKLARVTRTSSKWGNIFDHGIDLIHPPFWYAAWAYGLASTPHALSQDVMFWTLLAIIAGYIAQRLMEGIAIKAFGLEIHVWRKIDTLFRQVTARRNPNLLILTVSVVLGRPDLGLIAVAWWTVICLGLHGLQLVQAELSRRKHGPLRSWMSQPARTQ